LGAQHAGSIEFDKVESGKSPIAISTPQLLLGKARASLGEQEAQAPYHLCSSEASRTKDEHGESSRWAPWNSLDFVKLLVAILIPFALWRVGMQAISQLQKFAHDLAVDDSELAYQRARQQFLASKNSGITKFYLQTMRESGFYKRGVQLSMVISQGTTSRGDADEGFCPSVRFIRAGGHSRSGR
jgi:hypothetical protein